MIEVRGTKKLVSMLAVLAIMFTSADFAGAGQVYAADKDYSYTFGTAEEYLTFNKSNVRDSFYYSDDWFNEDPGERNDELALMSMQLTASAVDDDDLEEGSKTGEAYLKKLGFDDIGSYGFHTEDQDDCAYLYGIKKHDGNTIIAVIVESIALDKDIKKKGWIQNFTVNGETEETTTGEHYALSTAAENVLDDIASLANDAEGNVKYWVMGHSRGGALANLIAAKLPAALEKANVTDSSIYAYTFEAPSVTDSETAHDQKYAYIHNYKADNDIVTMVPPADWGMTLYGEDAIPIRTAESDAVLNKALEDLGSDARLKEIQDLDDYAGSKIVEKLLAKIPTRAEYSEQHTDSFTARDGREITVDYTVQGTFAELMGTIFGDGISAAGIADHLSDLNLVVDPAVRGYLIETGKLAGDESDSNAYYYEAAEQLEAFLKTEDGESQLKADVLYVLLKIAAPIIIDTDAAKKGGVPSDGILDVDTAFMYVMPLMKIAANSDELTFSHNFDTVIARMKIMAPAPEMENINITIDDPEAGDSTLKAPRDIEKAASELGNTWLDVSASWITDDTSLRNNSIRYLDVKYYIEGHSVPDSTSFTLNGESPADDARIYTNNGITVASCTYEFTLGTPKMLTLDFDSEQGGDFDPMELPYGKMLKYVEQPEVMSVSGYRFDGWYTSEEAPWDDVILTKNNSMYAKWIKEIDNLKITFTVPKVGQVWSMPAAPKNAPYHLEDVKVINDDYNAITKITKKEKLTLEFIVAPNSGSYELKGTSDEDDYTGKLTVSGAKVGSSNIDYRKYLVVSCTFTPLDNAKTALQKGGAYSAADKVIKASKSEKTLSGAAKKPLYLKVKKRTKKSVTLTWKKATGAKKYVVYGALKGKKFKKIKTLKSRKCLVKKAGTKLRSKKKYKFIVVAVDKNNKVVSTSKTVIVRLK